METYMPYALCSSPEPGITLVEPATRFYTVNVRVKDATAMLDIDTFVAVEATSSGDAIRQAKQAFRNAYNRPPYYERYEIISQYDRP